MFDLLESWLRHKSDIVVYEAARALTALPGLSPRDYVPAVTALQLMLLSRYPPPCSYPVPLCACLLSGISKPTLRFAAVRTLNRLAQTVPAAVWSVNMDMENLITDPNRSIATFAITTLLKVCCFIAFLIAINIMT